MNLSEIIHAYRADRPDEWTLDEWVKKATVLEKRIAELEKERDEISLAQFVYAYSMDQHRNPIDLYHWLIKWNHLKALKEQGE